MYSGLPTRLTGSLGGGVSWRLDPLPCGDLKNVYQPRQLLVEDVCTVLHMAWEKIDKFGKQSCDSAREAVIRLKAESDELDRRLSSLRYQEPYESYGPVSSQRDVVVSWINRLQDAELKWCKAPSSSSTQSPPDQPLPPSSAPPLPAPTTPAVPRTVPESKVSASSNAAIYVASAGLLAALVVAAGTVLNLKK